MNEITLYEKMTDPLAAVDRLGVALAKSGMFNCDNENAGKVLAMICMTERKSPVEIIRTYDIIGGKLRKKAMAAYAEFRARGGKVKWLATGEDGQMAKAEFTFEGQTITLQHTLEQAKKAGAIFKDGSNWVKTPGNMLRARVISNALGMLCPEIFAGGDDSDMDDVPASAPEIKLAGTTEPAKPATVQTATVTVEAEVVKPVQTQPVQSSPSPTKPADATGVAQPTAAPAASATSTAPVLPAEVVTALETAIGAEHAVQAGKWLIAQGWIKPGEGLANLSSNRANRIIKQTASFLRAVTGSVA